MRNKDSRRFDFRAAMHALNCFSFIDSEVRSPVLLCKRFPQRFQDSLSAIRANQIVIRRPLKHKCDAAKYEHHHQAYAHYNHLTNDTKGNYRNERTYRQ